MTGTNGGASAPPPSPSMFDEIVSAVASVIGRFVVLVARTLISLWAFSVPVIAGFVIYARSTVWSWWQLVIASLLPVVWLIALYQTGHLHGCWRAHRLRGLLRAAREHVVSQTLPRHRPLTTRGRIVGFDVQGHPGWNHAQVLASVADLLAFYHLPPDVQVTTTARSHGHVEVLLNHSIPLPEQFEMDAAELGAWASEQDGLVLGRGAAALVVIRPTESPHLLIIGQTGTGKSVLGYSLTAQALLKGWRVVAVDPKQLDLAWLSNYGVTPATTPEAASLALAELKDEMDNRMTACRDAGVSHVRDLSTPLQPVLVVVEEAAELADVGSKPPKDSPALPAWQARSECLEYITSIARLGRAADIHLLLMAQRPDAAILGGQLRSQLGARVIVSNAGDRQATQMVGLAGDDLDRWLESERPPGRFVVTTGSDWVVGQAPYVSMRTLRNLDLSS